MRTWVDIGRRGLLYALAGGVIFGATPRSMSARGWGDPTDGRLLVQIFKPSEYQTNARIGAAVQDRDGVLYFASEGLLQYDGSAWRHYSADLGINGLAIDEVGRIWVGGIGVVGYFEKGPLGQLKYSSLRGQLPPDYHDQFEIWGVEVTERGIVFSAADKIMRWDGNSFTIWPLKDARRAISQKIGDTVYTLHPTTGLWKLSGDKPVLVMPSGSKNVCRRNSP